MQDFTGLQTSGLGTFDFLADAMWLPLRQQNVSIGSMYEPFPLLKIKLYAFSNSQDNTLDPSFLSMSQSIHTLHANGNGVPIL